MRSALRLVALLAIAGGSAGQAHACLFAAGRDLADVRRADLVVTGRIANYEVVLDQATRAYNRKLLADPTISPLLREDLAKQTVFSDDYSRFDIVVDRVLAGAPAEIVRAIWDNSAPEAPHGRLLIALRYPGFRAPEANKPAVMQPRCAQAFIFDDASEEADSIRRILGAPERSIVEKAIYSRWVVALPAVLGLLGLLWAGLTRRRAVKVKGS